MAQRTVKSGKSNKRASLECDEENQKHRNTVTYKKVTCNVYHQNDEYMKEKKVVERSISVVASYKAKNTNTTSITEEEVILEEQKKMQGYSTTIEQHCQRYYASKGTP